MWDEPWDAAAAAGTVEQLRQFWFRKSAQALAMRDANAVEARVGAWRAALACCLHPASRMLLSLPPASAGAC